MAAYFHIYSPLTPKDAEALVDTCDDEIAKYLHAHPDPDVEEGYGELSAHDDLPTRSEIREWNMGEPTEAVAERLARCRSRIEVYGPVPDSKLQVSVLLYLLERVGEALCGGITFAGSTGPFALVEDELVALRGLPFAKYFMNPKARDDDEDAGLEEATAAVAAALDPGPTARAKRIHDILSRAIRERDLGLDAQRALRKVSPLAQRYGALLLSKGVMPDEQAGKELALQPKAMEVAAAELDRALAAIME